MRQKITVNVAVFLSLWTFLLGPAASAPIADIVNAVPAQAVDLSQELAKLRAGASATPKYHEHLLKIAKDAPSLDAAHLNLLLDACYFPAAVFETLVQERWALHNGPESRANAKKLREIGRVIDSAEELGGYSNKILLAGLPKTTDLTLGSGVGLLGKLYPFWGASEAFHFVLDKFPVLSADQEYHLIKLANTKSASDVAIGLGVNWFRKHSDKSIEALEKLSGEFGRGRKDEFIEQALNLFPRLSAKDMLRVVEFSENPEAIIMARYRKISNLNPDSVVKLVGIVSGTNKHDLITQYLDSTNRITTAELERLAAEFLWSDKSPILMPYWRKVSDLTVSNAIRLVENLGYYKKDEFLLSAVEKVTDLNSENLPRLAAHADNQEKEILQRGLKRLAAGK